MTPPPQRREPHSLVDRLWLHIRRQLGVNQTAKLLREIRDEQTRIAADVAALIGQLGADPDSDTDEQRDR